MISQYWSGNGALEQQAIVNPDLCRHMASLCHNALTRPMTDMTQTTPSNIFLQTLLGNFIKLIEAELRIYASVN